MVRVWADATAQEKHLTRAQCEAEAQQAYERAGGKPGDFDLAKREAAWSELAYESKTCIARSLALVDSSWADASALQRLETRAQCDAEAQQAYERAGGKLGDFDLAKREAARGELAGTAKSCVGDALAAAATVWADVAEEEREEMRRGCEAVTRGAFEMAGGMARWQRHRRRNKQHLPSPRAWRRSPFARTPLCAHVLTHSRSHKHTRAATRPRSHAATQPRSHAATPLSSMPRRLPHPFLRTPRPSPGRRFRGRAARRRSIQARDPSEDLPCRRAAGGQPHVGHHHPARAARRAAAVRGADARGLRDRWRGRGGLRDRRARCRRGRTRGEVAELRRGRAGGARGVGDVGGRERTGEGGRAAGLRGQREARVRARGGAWGGGRGAIPRGEARRRARGAGRQVEGLLERARGTESGAGGLERREGREGQNGGRV